MKRKMLVPCLLMALLAACESGDADVLPDGGVLLDATVSCEAGACDASAPRWDGIGESTCTAALPRYLRTCSEAGELRGRCYRTCSGPSDVQCPSGYSCRATSTVPEGGDCTTPKVDAFLCLRDCEVRLRLDVVVTAEELQPPRQSATLPSGIATTTLRVWAENLTDDRKTLRLLPSCMSGVRISGMGLVDQPWACSDATCVRERTGDEVVMPPHSSSFTPIASVSLGGPFECRRPELPAGEYSVRYVLEDVQGATFCGPEPLPLHVR